MFDGGMRERNMSKTVTHCCFFKTICFQFFLLKLLLPCTGSCLAAHLAPVHVDALVLALGRLLVVALGPVDGLARLAWNVSALLSRHLVAYVLLHLLGHGPALFAWHVVAHLEQTKMT